MSKFDKDGRLIIPLTKRVKAASKKDEDKIRYVVTEAYCPKGCSIIDHDHKINGSSGLRIKFKRKDEEGEFVLSAIEGDFKKIILSGTLENGKKDDLFCPHCGTMIKKLINCGCTADSDMVVIGLTPKLDFNNAITFCNVTGCEKGTFVKSGDVIRHLRLGS